MKLREIAEVLAIDIARVSRLVAEGEERMEKDPVFRAHAQRAVKLLTEMAKH